MNAMLESMPSSTFAEWMAFFRLEPWGDERDNLRAGIVASTIANCHRTKGAAFKPTDFMPQYERPRPSWQEMRAKFKAGWNAYVRGGRG